MTIQVKTTSGERAQAMRQATAIFLGEFPALTGGEPRRDYAGNPVIGELANAADAERAGVEMPRPRDGAR